MTIDIERMRAINNARDFLRALLDPTKTPNVTKRVREEARGILKHYPEQYWMEEKLPKESLELKQEDARFYSGRIIKSRTDEL
jgi:hypothetical protein